MSTDSLETRLLETLAEFGKLRTGQLRELTAPHYATFPEKHGGFIANTEGKYVPACPGCTCTKTIDATRTAGPQVRAALTRLEKAGRVQRLRSLEPNNYGGHGWMLTPQEQERYDD